MRNKRIFTEITVLLLVVLFLYTGVSKFIDFKSFTNDLDNQPFPNSLTPFLRWIIPLTEISIVVLLIYEKTRIVGLYASLIMMCLFTIYTILVLFEVFEYVPCSCGGVIKKLTWTQHVILNLFFVGITYIAIRKPKKTKTQTIYII